MPWGKWWFSYFIFHKGCRFGIIDLFHLTIFPQEKMYMYFTKDCLLRFFLFLFLFWIKYIAWIIDHTGCGSGTTKKVKLFFSGFPKYSSWALLQRKLGSKFITTFYILKMKLLWRIKHSHISVDQCLCADKKHFPYNNCWGKKIDIISVLTITCICQIDSVL